MTIEYRERPEIREGELVQNVKVLSHSLTWIGAFDDEKLIGFANVAWDGGVHAFLLDPTVLPSHRHRGIGSQLVRSALAAVAKVPGIEWVHVDSDEALMKDFYEPAGFRPTPAGLVWVDDLRP